TAGPVTVQDRATLSGGSGYTGLGTLSFVLEDSSNAAIAGTSFSTAVSANGNFDTPATAVSLPPGTYHSVVSFRRDPNNTPPPPRPSPTRHSPSARPARPCPPPPRSPPARSRPGTSRSRTGPRSPAASTRPAR